MNDAISAGVPRNPSLMALRTIHRLNRMLPAMAQYRSHDLTLLTPCPRYGDQYQSERIGHERQSRAHWSIIPFAARSMPLLGLTHDTLNA